MAVPDLDLSQLITVEAAAEHCGVRPVTIRQWVSRGHLTPIGRGPNGRLLFNVLDVARAEQATRERARRPQYSPSTQRSHRRLAA